MPAVYVPLAVALDAIAEILEVGAEGTDALRARVRQFADMGLPRVGRAEANARMRYGLPELTELGFAFLLTNVGMAPLAAARYVRENWTHIAPVAVMGIGDALPEGYRERRPPRARGPMLVIKSEMLGHLGKRGVREGLGNIKFTSPAVGEVNETLSSVLASVPSALIFNTAAFMPGIVAVIARHATVPEDLWDSIDALRLSERALE